MSEQENERVRKVKSRCPGLYSIQVVLDGTTIPFMSGLENKTADWLIERFQSTIAEAVAAERERCKEAIGDLGMHAGIKKVLFEAIDAGASG